jgi:hypothetical protein
LEVCGFLVSGKRNMAPPERPQLSIAARILTVITAPAIQNRQFL